MQRMELALSEDPHHVLALGSPDTGCSLSRGQQSCLPHRSLFTLRN